MAMSGWKLRATDQRKLWIVET
ncbi:protein of unknown function [Azospirillum baldaniorum]|uniref:Uncharacterized protein n=1 Tax=Azospirillum baldaniorum TaxID=1064539 RepID=A0A9P1NNH6_9PROT|nr:protein of unknown function [Azospirillum baldaniorum]